MSDGWVSDVGPSPEATHPGKGWLLVCLLAGLTGIVLLVSFLGVRPYLTLAAVVAVPIGIWLVFAQPIWAILLYIVICASPLFGIYDYIEPGEYAAGALLILLFLREGLRGGIANDLGRLFKSYLALVAVFGVSLVMVFFFHNGLSAWAREQAQYLPILLGPIVARNLRSRRQVVAIVVVSAFTAILALPFESYQFLLAREASFKILTGEEFAGIARLPLPHFSVLNAGTFSALLGSWLLIRKARPWRVANYALVAIVPAMMLLAESRIWTAMAILSLLLPFVLWAKRKQLLKLMPKLAILLVFVVAGLFVAYKGVETLNPDLADILVARLVPLQSAGDDESVGIRWQGALYLAKIVAESPILGHGLGYEVSLSPWKWAQLTSSVSAFDNAHLALLIKFGILGAVTFYWLFWLLGRQAYDILRRSRMPLDIVVSASFLAGLICIILVGFAYSALNVFENTNFLGIWAGMVLYLRKDVGRVQSQ